MGYRAERQHVADRLTRIERLLGGAAGEEVELPVDLIVTDDWTTPALLAPLEALGTERAAAPVVLVRDHTLTCDHYEGADLERMRRLREVEDRFVGGFGARRITGSGIQHHVLPETGLLRPGMLVLGNDSHTPTLGAHGVVALAAQPTTVAAAIHTGRVVLRVPDTLRVRVEGELQPGVSVRDASLTLLDLLRAGSPYPRLATGKALEFCGSGLASLRLAQWAILANATPEAAAVTATFPSAGEGVDGFSAPASATEILLDLGEVRPSVARSGHAADVAQLEVFEETRVTTVFVGTCAGGTFEEIEDFAAELGSGPLAIRAMVAPASAAIQERLRESGVLDRLISAGVELLPPGCGPCFGFGPGRLGDDDVAVVTGNRNGIGRMGSPRAKIHLASGRSAGKAARAGKLGSAGGATETSSASKPRIVWPRGGNVVRLFGSVSTDDLTPSAVPGIGTSNDDDPAVLRRLLFYHLDPTSAGRDLAGTVLVADENFGIGSNRASAVRALLVAGVTAVIARSVSPLYAMGARDEGLLLVVLEDDEFYRLADPAASVNLDVHEGKVVVHGHQFAVAPASSYELALRAAGGVIPYLQERSRDENTIST